MAAAKRTDLPDLLKHLGYSVRRVGSRYHTTREMDSIRIKDRRTWKRYSNGTGGDAISSSQSPLYSVSAYGENCVRSLASPLPTKSSILRGPQRQEFGGKDFREAVNYLLEFNGCRTRDSPAPRPQPVQTKEKPAFALPIAHADQRRVFAYLQKRGIAPQVIWGFIEAGLLYEDSLYHVSSRFSPIPLSRQRQNRRCACFSNHHSPAASPSKVHLSEESRTLH